MSQDPTNTVNYSSIDSVLDQIKQEVIKVASKKKPYNSAHEGWAVLYEEVDELWEEVRKKSSKRIPADMATECVQIAACAIRFITDVCGEKPNVE